MLRLIHSLVLLTVLAGCAAAPRPVAEKLDPLTSATLTYSAVTLVMYRDDPTYAAHARNFVSLGPFEVNRSGRYQYYLWLGIWNTNQPASVEQRREGFESIVIFADGEPLQLELVGWTPDVVGASEPVYPKPVATSLDAYYRVSADQIRLLAKARDLRLLTTGFAPRTYEPWDEQVAARLSFQRLLERL